MMSGVPLETCWDFNKLWNNNKFYYKTVSCWNFYWVNCKEAVAFSSKMLVPCWMICHFAGYVVGGWHDYSGLVTQNKVNEVQDLRFSQRCWRLNFLGYDALSSVNCYRRSEGACCLHIQGLAYADPGNGGRNQTQHTEAPSSETSVVYQSTWHSIEDGLNLLQGSKWVYISVRRDKFLIRNNYHRGAYIF
jgi:hypothetical protein